MSRLNNLSTSIRTSGAHQSDGTAERFCPQDRRGRELTREFESRVRVELNKLIPQATEPLRSFILKTITARWTRLLYGRSQILAKGVHLPALGRSGEATVANFVIPSPPEHKDTDHHIVCPYCGILCPVQDFEPEVWQ
jgi:hypothetical protein